MRVQIYNCHLCIGVIFVFLIIYLTLIDASANIDKVNNGTVVKHGIATYPDERCIPHKTVTLNYRVNPQAKCYRSCSNQSLPYLSSKLSETERPIFFIESSCKSYDAGKIVLNPKQACSIESAVRQNPQRQIYVLFVSSADVEKRTNSNIISDPMIRTILNYPNVAFKHVDYESYVDNSPVAPLLATSSTENSDYFAIEHTSDLLRLVTLWRYGGIYMDLDVISITSVDKLKENFGVYENMAVVGNTVMGYNQDGIGHEFLEKCLEDFRHNYNGSSWMANGPFLITRNLLKICNLTIGRELKENNCEIKIYEPETFFPIYFPEWQKFFNETFADEVMRRIKNSVAVHLWNKLSSVKAVYKNSTCAYMQMARRYCPGVYDAAPELFG